MHGSFVFSLSLSDTHRARKAWRGVGVMSTALCINVLLCWQEDTLIVTPLTIPSLGVGRARTKGWTQEGSVEEGKEREGVRVGEV